MKQRKAVHLMANQEVRIKAGNSQCLETLKNPPPVARCTLPSKFLEPSKLVPQYGDQEFKWVCEEQSDLKHTTSLNRNKMLKVLVFHIP